jgi:predicted dehydrogenase
LQVAQAAVERGCHVFIEKPLSHSLDGIGTLREAAGAHGVRVYPGFHFRFHPGLETVKRLLEEGAIGEVLSAQGYWGEYLPGWHPAEDHRQGYSARADLGGGVILTLSHPFDYVRWLLGEVDTVTAVAGAAALGLDVEDVADVTLRLSSGVQVHTHLDYLRRPAAHWLEVTGNGGVLRWDAIAHSVACHRTATGAWESFPPEAGFERNAMFVSEMRHFLDCAADPSVVPRVSFEDGVRALEVALAARQSAVDGRTVVVSR